MTSKEIEKTALEIGEPVAAEQGVYIVDVSYEKRPDGFALCFYIDRADGVGIDECEAFSRAVEAKLDEKDPIDGNYVLEVSSPGVDRRLTKEREFMYYVGREVDVKLFKELDGVKEFTGVLSGYSNKTAIIDRGGETYEIPVKQAAYIKLSFRF